MKHQEGSVLKREDIWALALPLSNPGLGNEGDDGTYAVGGGSEVL